MMGFSRCRPAKAGSEVIKAILSARLKSRPDTKQSKSDFSATREVVP